MYATLQEAFGVSSFAQGVAQNAPVSPRTYTVPTGGRPLALRGDVGPIAKRNDARQRQNLQKAHATGGAKAAWKVVPPRIRADMVRYVRQKDTSPDVAVVLVVAVAMVLLLI